MRSGFLSLCGLLALPVFLLGQDPGPPFVAEQPVGISAYVGDTVALRTTVNGTAPLQLQWHRDGAALTGATTSVYTISSAVLADTALYYLTAINAYGSATTAPVVIIVTKRPQTITFSPASTVAVAGTSVALSATSSANLPVTLTLVSGAASINGTLLTGLGGTVVVRASQAGNETFAAAETVDRTFSFVSGSLSPFITSPPIDQIVEAGTTATFRATAIGTPAPTYQWEKDGVALAGATNPALILAATTLTDAGRYGVTVTNASGRVSAAANLTVRAAPVITDAPASQTVAAGESVSLAVTATGFPAPTYQWRKNGAAIPGATRSTLSFASALAADAGRYEVVVTNALGATATPAAILTVTTRDFSGTYFGRFAGATGDFVLLVRPDRTAVFLAHLPGLQTGIAASDLRIELSGSFSLGLNTLASADAPSPVGMQPGTAAAPQAVTLRGTVNEITGYVTGQVPELDVMMEGTRAPGAGFAAANAGFYRIALIGTAAGGYLVVAPDGQAFVLTSSGTIVDGARGTLAPDGRFSATTSTQAVLEFSFTEGVVSGTVRASTGATGTVGGATEQRAGDRRLVNLSVRAMTAPGAAALITGFVVAGNTSKQVLIRAAGPALDRAPFNVANALDDPTIQLFRGSNAIAQNDDWSAPAANVTPITAATTRVGAFPFQARSADAAILTTLTPGPYTFAIGGGNGVVLAEVYEVLANNEVAGARRLVNLSARGIVTPAAPLIAGFVISGSAPQLVLLRGIGPALSGSPFNVAGALSNPQLTLFRGSSVVKTNDDWFRDSEASLVRIAAVRAGAFALGASSLDAAMLLHLPPGAYTVQVSGPTNANQANGTGLAIVEIYESAM